MPARSVAGRRHRRHRRAKGSTRRRLRLLPPPAAIGVLAVVIAGGGVLAGPDSPLSDGPDGSGGAGGTTLLTRTATSLSGSDGPGNVQGDDTPTERGSRPRVSRGGVDRADLARQADRQAAQREAALESLAHKSKRHADELERRAARRKARQWVLPVTGYHLTARFGQSSGLWSTVHTGLDFAAPSGTRIVSVARGTVSEVGYDGAYGNRTVVTLADGTKIWYCHQSSTQVSMGQQVDPGDPIGTVGSTGNVTGPHLHLEVHPGGGDPVDPVGVLHGHNVTP